MMNAWILHNDSKATAANHTRRMLPPCDNEREAQKEVSKGTHPLERRESNWHRGGEERRRSQVFGLFSVCSVR